MTLLPHEKQIAEYEKTISALKKSNKKGEALLGQEDVQKLEAKLEKLKSKVYSNLSPWERVLICRHHARPRSKECIEAICDSFTELSGDRRYGDDHALVGGIAKINGQKFVIMGNEKGNDTESRVFRNFGMLHPEGFRKAMRLMKLAERFRLPVITLIDTPGAYPGLAAEERGQGLAIAENLRDMAMLTVPIIVCIIGEGCSGGALGTGVGDVIGIMEHAYYSVISPEGCASILWKDPAKNTLAASALKLHGEHLIEQGIVDEIIKEPQGGGHLDRDVFCENLKEFILRHAAQLKAISPEMLVDQRYNKFRSMGAVSVKETAEV